MKIGRTLMYGSAAMLAAGAVGWEMARRRADSDMQHRFDEPENDELFLSEREIWQSVSEDVEPTLLGNPDGVMEFQREKAALLEEPPGN